MKNVIKTIVGSVLSTLAIGAVVFSTVQFKTMTRMRASAFSMTLDHSNAPTLLNGEGTMTDTKNVTWEYYNASDYPNGHITLNADSYFGISSSTSWGVTAIAGITASFTGDDLWLLKSTDGVEWHEAETLTSGEETYAANDWRYVRFYNYSSVVNINSITIDYNCSGISAAEDVDLAKYSNVRTSNILEAESTNTVSPRSTGGQALRLFNGQSGDSSYIVVSFPQVSSWHNIFTDKIEFDYYHANNQYKPSVQLMNGNKKVGTTQKYDTTKSNYKVSDIDSDWWHCEIPISSLTALYVDYGDTATGNCPVDGIRIVSSGNCIIDNLKIGSSPCELGNYNSATYKPSVGSYLWIKTCWVGVLHSVDIDDSSPLFTYIDNNDNSPFYIYCDAAGTVDVTVEVECGYNHRTYTITKTITIQ